MKLHLWVGLLLVALLPAHSLAQARPDDPNGYTGPTADPARPNRAAPDLVAPGAVGMSEEKLRAVDALIERAIAEGVTPGAALAIGRRGQLVRLRGYGRLDWAPEAELVSETSIFDVASLTKPVVTATAVMLLMREKRFDLDAPLFTYLPEFLGAGDRRTMTARHLLGHMSGLPAGGPLAGVFDRGMVPRFMATAKLRAAPGSRFEYSDYGLILLGVLVERVAGETLDAYIRSRIFEPLGLLDSGFNPFVWPAAGPEAARETVQLAAGGAGPGAGAGEMSAADESPFRLTSAISALLARIAPTERTRAGHLHGVVHDPLAARLGGVTGHAGLFSSARDLAVFAQMIVDHGRAGDRALIDSALIARFTRPVSPGARYAFGWEMARPGGPAGDLFSPHSFGHTGFTGTSLWIDPDKDLYVVLLTNRVNPSARERRHIPLRRAVHDAIQEAIVDR